MRDAHHAARADLAPLVRAAAAGDERSWNALVTGLDGVLRGVVRGYRLPSADVDDVVQTTWLRALEHMRRLQDPGAIAGWLVVTARREAMRTLQRGVREVLTEEPANGEAAGDASPEAILMARERQAALHGAVARLAGRQRTLLTSMLAASEPDYEELSSVLDMPVGSIGPTRKRALARLREDIRLEEVMSS
jgi:RNA polymerase sigma factor (sigma-70 family)